MNRNYGIDLLRLVAMYLVVILHVLGVGGVLARAENTQYYVSWFLEIMAYCAVNCYAIISGYVCYREKETTYQYLKYIIFWMPVFFYSFGITLVAFILNPESVGIKVLIKSALPVASDQYWYVSAYTPLFFAIPWINKMIHQITAKEMNKLVIMIFGVFCGYATFSSLFSDPFKLEGGYSFIWLLILYIVGAWIKKNRINEKLKCRFWIILMLVSVVAAWLFKIFSPFVNSVLVSYISFTVVIEAVSLVILFSRINFNSKAVSIVRKLSPAAFGVYLIHVQGIIWDRGIRGAFSWIAQSASWLLALEVLGCAFAVYVICLCIELFRLAIFKALNINGFVLGKANSIKKMMLSRILKGMTELLRDRYVKREIKRII